MKRIIIIALLITIGLVFSTSSTVFAKRPAPIYTPPVGGVICPDDNCLPIPTSTPEAM
ncbi:MAG: hypothetical protein WA152_02920 [Microgenomates group bacterium]